MTAPFIRIVCNDGNSYPAEVISPFLGAGAPTAPVTGAPVSSRLVPCPECDGSGEAEYMALDETSYSWSDCHVCDGVGKVEAVCDVCEGKLTDGLCPDCDIPSDDYGIVVRCLGDGAWRAEA